MSKLSTLKAEITMPHLTHFHVTSSDQTFLLRPIKVTCFL